MNLIKKFVTGLGNQTAPFGFAPEDPEAGYKAGLGYIGDIGANLLANNQGGVDPFANLGASMLQAKDSSTRRNKEQYTAQRLMEEAAVKRQEREQAEMERKRREDYINTLPADVRMKAMSIPGYLDSWIAANDPSLQQPDKPTFMEVNGKIVNPITREVIYDGGGSAGVKWKETTLDDGVYWVDESNPGNRIKVGERPNRNEGEGRSFAQETKLRGEYTTEAKPFTDLRTNYQKIAASSEDQTGASDIALVYSFMKMLDPTSVVREGEFATAANAGGVDSKIMSLYNQVLNGQKLSPQIRADFVQQAGRQYEQQMATYEKIQAKYRGLAEKLGLDPMNVAPDLTYGIVPLGSTPLPGMPQEVNRAAKGNSPTQAVQRAPSVAPDIWELMPEEDRALWAN